MMSARKRERSEWHEVPKKFTKSNFCFLARSEKKGCLLNTLFSLFAVFCTFAWLTAWLAWFCFFGSLTVFCVFSACFRIWRTVFRFLFPKHSFTSHFSRKYPCCYYFGTAKRKYTYENKKRKRLIFLFFNNFCLNFHFFNIGGCRFFFLLLFIFLFQFFLLFFCLSLLFQPKFFFCLAF